MWKLMILNMKLWMFQIRIIKLYYLLANMNTFVMSLFEKKIILFYVFEPMDFSFTFISIAQFSTYYHSFILCNLVVTPLQNKSQLTFIPATCTHNIFISPQPCPILIHKYSALFNQSIIYHMSSLSLSLSLSHTRTHIDIG